MPDSISKIPKESAFRWSQLEAARRIPPVPPLNFPHPVMRQMFSGRVSPDTSVDVETRLRSTPPVVEK
jgi:hypothetical protein